MSSEYLCCSCEQLFPTEQAIDGFKQGYPKGFLCPHCGANIDENRTSLLKDFVIIFGILFVGLNGATSGKYSYGDYQDWSVMMYAVGLAMLWGIVTVFKSIRRSRKPIPTRDAKVSEWEAEEQSLTSDIKKREEENR